MPTVKAYSQYECCSQQMLFCEVMCSIVLFQPPFQHHKEKKKNRKDFNHSWFSTSSFRKIRWHWGCFVETDWQNARSKTLESCFACCLTVKVMFLSSFYFDNMELYSLGKFVLKTPISLPLINIKFLRECFILDSLNLCSWSKKYLSVGALKTIDILLGNSETRKGRHCHVIQCDGSVLEYMQDIWWISMSYIQIKAVKFHVSCLVLGSCMAAANFLSRQGTGWTS